MSLEIISKKKLFGQMGGCLAHDVGCQVKRDDWHPNWELFEIQEGILWDKKLLPDKISSSDSCIKFNLFVFGMHLILDSNGEETTYFSTKNVWYYQQKWKYTRVNTLPINLISVEILNWCILKLIFPVSIRPIFSNCSININRIALEWK